MSVQRGQGGNNNASKNGKYACIFSYEENVDEPSHKNIEDTNLIIEMLTSLHIKVQNQAEVESETSENDDDDENEVSMEYKYNELVVLNSKPKALKTFVVEFIQNRKEAQCILLYFIVRQDGKALRTADGKDLPLFSLWRSIEGIKCPVLFIIQPNITGKSAVNALLLNSDEDGSGDSTYNLPRSANMLLAYLPNSPHGRNSVAKLLSDELPKPFDLYTNLTKVIERMNSDGCRLSPKFSSTILQELYLAEGLQSGKKVEDLSRCVFSKRHIAKSFIFGKYSNSKLDIYQSLQHDRGNIDKLKEIGFELEHCIQDGTMTAKQFEDKLKDILRDGALESCECMLIIVSTHGLEGDKLLAYDKSFSVDFIWEALCSCNQLANTPKLLLVDACRGSCPEDPETHTKNINSKGVPDKGSSERKGPTQPDKDTHMSDTLIIMATTEGKMSFSTKHGGSLLIRNFCQELATKGGNVLDILTSTMNKVAEEDITMLTDTGPIKVKQQITFTSTLQKCLHIQKK